MRRSAELRDGRGAEDHRLDHRHVRSRAPGRFDHEAGGNEIETASAIVLTEMDAEKARSRQLLPEGAVDGTLFAAGTLNLLETFVRRALAENPIGQLTDSSLFFAVAEIHAGELLCGVSARPRHSEAEDGDQISLDLVGAAAEGQEDHVAGVPLEAPRQDGGRCTLGEIAGLPENFHQ